MLSKTTLWDEHKRVSHYIIHMYIIVCECASTHACVAWCVCVCVCVGGGVGVCVCVCCGCVCVLWAVVVVVSSGLSVLIKCSRMSPVLSQGQSGHPMCSLYGYH